MPTSNPLKLSHFSSTVTWRVIDETGVPALLGIIRMNRQPRSDQTNLGSNYEFQIEIGTSENIIKARKVVEIPNLLSKLNSLAAAGKHVSKVFRHLVAC